MLNQDQRVVVVTVTFNDSEYLLKQLSYLRRQTVKLHKIVVVDNNSSQENKEKLMKEADDLVDIVWLDQNYGGAGGFENGMKYANEIYEPDWFWLMDADAFPEPDCLEKLLAHSSYSARIGILAPLIFGVDLKEYQLYHHKVISKYLYRDIPIFTSYNDIINDVTKIEADAFVGPLVSKAAVDEFGYADGGLFIYGDDLEYTYRVSRKFDVLLVKDAIINHRDQPVNKQQKPSNWWKDYYAFRNWFLFIDKYKQNSFQSIIGKGMLLLRVIKQLCKNCFSRNSRSLKKLRKQLILNAVFDGQHGRRGRTIDPQEIREIVKSYGGE